MKKHVRTACKLLSGQMLTQKEFETANAWGLLLGEQRYEILRLYHCQDGDWSGYIDAGEQEPPQDGFDQMRPAGWRHPEELHLHALRPEQLDYFKNEMPPILDRFQK